MFIKGKGRSVSYPTANHPSHGPARTCRGLGGPCIPAAALVLHHPLERPVRLTGSPDSAGYSTGCRGDSATAGSPGNTPLCSTECLVAQPRWGNPQGQMPGHVPVVRFANREPAAVIQTVVHCMLQNRFAGFRIYKVVGKNIGRATSRARHSFQAGTQSRKASGEISQRSNSVHRQTMHDRN